MKTAGFLLGMGMALFGFLGTLRFYLHELRKERERKEQELWRLRTLVGRCGIKERP